MSLVDGTYHVASELIAVRVVVGVLIHFPDAEHLLSVAFTNNLTIHILHGKHEAI